MKPIHERWTEEYEYVEQGFNVADAKETSRAIYEANKKAWCENVKANLTREDGIDWISDRFMEKTGPVLVCGAGPSFHQNFDKVKEIAKFATIICVDRAFDTFYKNGIVPDYVMCMDASPIVRYFIDGVSEKSCVVACVYVHPITFDYAKEQGCKTYLYGLANPYNPIHKKIKLYSGTEHHEILEGCVVGFSACDLAVKLGYTTVYTIGNDLCYKTLADVYKSGAHLSNTILEIKGASGSHTISSFWLAKLSFDCMPQYYPEIKFVDASDGIIESWERCTPEEMVCRMKDERGIG